MLQFVRTSALLFGAQMQRVLRTKRALACILLALVPVGVAVLVAVVAHEESEAPPGMSIGWILQVQVIMPILALIMGAAVVSEEVEDRTLTFLFTRPMPRPALLIGRWLAAAVFLAVILTASAAATSSLLRASMLREGSQSLPEDPLLPLLATVVIGALVYSAAFAALGTLLKHPMIVGLGYVFAIEGFLSNLPGKTQVLTIQYYLRSAVVGLGSDAWKKLDVFQTSLFEPGREALTTLAIILFGSLLLGSVFLARRQYVLPA